MSRPLRRVVGDTLRRLRRVSRPAPPGLAKGVRPVSRVFGLDRGQPIDRYYIERFLGDHAALIRGQVLEVGDDRYTRRFGGTGLERARVLRMAPDPDPGTLVGDLSDPSTLPDAAFDCFVCTQTFNFVFPLAEAVRGSHRLLRSGGVMLATVAGISQISRHDLERWGDYWRFTPRGLRQLLAPVFDGGVTVRAYGNVLAATALLLGLAVEDLPEPSALDEDDPDYPVLITAVAHRAP